MKKFKILALFAVLIFMSVDTFGAGWFQDWRSSRQQRQVQRYQHRHHQGQCPPAGTPVGAPIDGGLLAILGAAGVAYYGVKKNKKNSVEE
ncbi:MAG: hypothetical protein ACOYXB_09745 [Bacteroidota bacterium]